ncbi:DEAD/DEAH box helicase [Arabiibacter massiliensis]|uniref:DEAD/DEAH box helicase n=1 Tax=Arabiibacter massiliensis TaxID=1870985 RepID=UPI0009BBD60B|nr:DEAD/DEAH box helicase [Arabiibacter massiliensis]
MVSEHEIGRHCNERALARARAIAASDRNILTKQVRYDGDETTLSAFVASSSGWDDRYRTSACFEDDSGIVLDYSCTCPAYREYDGMCKHCAALMLSYIRAPQRFLGYQAQRTRTTSACIDDFMKRAERLAGAQGAAGNVDIETTLACGYRSWSARFRLSGPQGSYVMKSISDFIERMRAGEFFSYGKKLAFHHVPAQLTEHARQIARFLDRAVALREQTSAAAYWRYRSSNVVGRDLELSDAEAVELLDLLAGREFAVEEDERGARRCVRTHVVEEDPRIAVALRPSERGGYLIERADPLALAAQGERLYVWKDGLFYDCSPEFARCADFLRNVYDSSEDDLYVAEADMPLFCAAALPAIEAHLHVDAPPEIAAYKPVPCQLEFFFDRDDARVTCDAWAAYGRTRHLLFGFENGEAPGRKEGPAPLRDERLEARAGELAAKYLDAPDASLPLADDEAVGALLFGGLAEFRALGSVFTTPAFDRLIRDKKPRVTLGVSLAGSLINLTVDSGDLPARELAALLASYRKRKRFHRLRDGVFLDLQDFDLAQIDRLAADLGITAKELASGSVELPAYRAFYLDEEADFARDRSFTRYVEGFRAADERAYDVPSSLAGVLRPYQAEGFRWLSARCDAGFGGVLADEMGLGKSVQLIALLLARRDEARAVGPSLIVCPASLVYNWLAEFERFAPALDVRAVAGTKSERAQARREAFEGGGCDVLVTSYDLLRIDAAAWAERELFCCALDEAQYIKNPAALTTRAVKRVRARHRFALTGTPMENRLSELWSIFDFLMPGLLGPYPRFRERFESPVVGGDEEVARRLQAAVGPFMLRRLKTDVLRELPDKLESIVYAPLTGEQLRLYAAHEQRLREELTAQRKNKNDRSFDQRKVEVLAELTKLRQLCCDPRLLYENYDGPAAKLDAIMELVGSARDAGEKTLVFSQFTSFLDRIAERLDAAGAGYYTITGATPKKRRLALVNAFNADGTPVFLVSLKAGGTGLNLTGASVVIHADPWWNAAAQNQATDRAHRIGQDKVVSVQKVIAQGTIEERIVRLQQAKSELAEQIIGAGGISLASLSREDLIDLLS